MSLAENAEENDANQSKFYRVLSSDPVTDANTLFDTLSKFLIKDKKRQLSTEFLDEKDKIALRLSWNDLRKVANSVLDDDGAQRNPIPVWVEQKEAIVLDDDDDDEKSNKYLDDTAAIHTKNELISSLQQQAAVPSDTIELQSKNNENNSDSGDKESMEIKKDGKKAKKEAKEARKFVREAKREAKKAKKETKKLQKEEKKRKREE